MARFTFNVYLASLLWGAASVAHTRAVPLDGAQAPIGLDLTRPDASMPKPLINSTALQSMITAEALMKRAEDLYAVANLSAEDWGHPTRVIGSKGHQGTLEYIASTLAKLGAYYTVSNQSFPALIGDVFESRLVIGEDIVHSAEPMRNTPPTLAKEPMFGLLLLVDNEGCDAADYPADLTGNIALIKRGSCSFGTKSELAGQAGAIAAVVYNNVLGGAAGSTLGVPSPDHVATFAISLEEATPYVEKLQAGDIVDASAYVDSIIQTVKTFNIMAQTVGGDPDNCVMLGGHSDSVGAGPGINDDGTGSLTLLEVATYLTHFAVHNCVRFAWWSGEEEGLLGSDYYVSQLGDADKAKIRLFMDYDMLASPNYAYQVYNATNAANPEGSEELRELYIEWYTQNGLNYTLIPFDGRSDYDAFIKNGIPGGGIAAGAEVIKTPEEKEMFGGKEGVAFDECYHELCDDTSNVDVDAWVVNTKLVAHSVATYARSFEGFPKAQAFESVSDAYAPQYHGGKLVI